MSGFFGWFIVIVGVIAVFNAEKLPVWRKMLEARLKDGVEVAKESSKKAKNKLEKVKSDMEARKNMTPEEKDPEENTPEEIEASMQFMGDYINKEPVPEEKSTVVEEKVEIEEVKEENEDEDKPITLDPM